MGMRSEMYCMERGLRGRGRIMWDNVGVCFCL